MPSEGSCWLMATSLSHMERGLWLMVNKTGCLEPDLQRVQIWGSFWMGSCSKGHLICQGLTLGSYPW